MTRLIPVVGAALVVLVLAACGGGEAAPAETTTVTVTETVTETETTPLEEDRAYLLASDFCEAAPLAAIALLQGGSPEELGRRFAEQIRPELREAALEGCLAGLARRD